MNQDPKGSFHHYLAGSAAFLSWCWPPLVVLLLIVAARFNYAGLGRYDPFYDSGVYLESARMISHGYAAYDRVFSSQPPLWVPLLRLSFFLFGESFLAGQLVVTTAGLIILAAVVAIVAHLQGRPSAILAGIFIMLAPTQVIWSHTVIAEAPSMAFAATAVALAARYLRIRRVLWLVLASIALTCSILTKLFGIYTIPAVLLLVSARWLGSRELERRAQLLGLGKDFLIMLVTSVVLTTMFASATNPLTVWDQAVQFHLKAMVSPPSSGDLRLNVLQYWQSDALLWAIAPLSIFSLLGGWRGLAVFVWMLSTLIGLLQHQPVFSHHLIALVPALTAAAAMGWGQLWRWPLRWWSSAQTLATRFLAVGSAALGLALGLLMAARLLDQAGVDQQIRQWAASDTKAAEADTLAARQLERVTLSNDVVLTDAQGIAFLANRDVPPGLTDTSFKRISTQYLLAREVIEESERSHVSAVLLWTGRLSQMPEVVAWVTKRFPFHQSFGTGRDLYVRTIPPTID